MTQSCTARCSHRYPQHERELLSSLRILSVHIYIWLAQLTWVEKGNWTGDQELVARQKNCIVVVLPQAISTPLENVYVPQNE